MSDDNDLNNRGLKAVDVASTYIQVLIGLASGIITAALAFYSDISKIPNFDLHFLKISFIFFGISICGGLCGLGGLVDSTANPKVSSPTDSRSAMVCVAIQFVGFAL
ncbi:MAG: hypothetical protein KGL95_14530, partial [Patescibacteria group bacterium]|nr:hypothetical protein [Patescibacteria group bacterium]